MDVVKQSVEQTIESFIQNGEVFTALDVSNAVKKNGIACRHGEVRDHVRKMFRTGQLTGYTRGSILVTLSDGNSDQAMLYYPDTLTDDEVNDRYDQSRRNQTALPSPGVVVTSVKLLTKPKMLGQFLLGRAKQLVASTDVDSDDPVV